PLFHPTMILLHDIVQVFTGSDLHMARQATRGFKFPDGPMRSGIRIESNDPRRSIVCLIALLKKRLAAATSRRSLSRKSTVRPCLSIEVGPAALNLDIGLITSPGAVSPWSVVVPALFELWNITLHPAQNRRMSHDNSAFGHHLD